MKLTAFFLLVCMLQINATTYSQKTRISLEMNDVQLSEVLNRIETISEFKFFVDTQKIDVKRAVDIKADKEKIFDILDKLFKGTNITYEVYKKQILLKKVEIAPTAPKSFGIDQSFIELDKYQQTITGTITDENGTPLPGANIIEKGTTNGTQADFDGNFAITLAENNAILLISYIGFSTKEIGLNGQTILNVQLEESASALDEIVVVGYGTVKKSDITGSVSSISDKDFNPGVNASVDQLIQGKASGVQIAQTSGEPGGGVSVRIRGSSSINAGNQPLYVIDGLPIDNGTLLSSGGSAGVGSNQNPRNPLNSLNPSDISSIEILKDASATAIYGSRGANGVVLITTKQGNSGKIKVDYEGYSGMQTIAKRIDILSTQEYISSINDISVEGGQGPVFNSSDISNIGAGTDWQDQIYISAPVASHNLSMSGGNENTTFRTSLNYFNQDGIVKNSGIEKYIARVNINSKIGENINVGININSSVIKNNNQIDGVNTNEQAGPIYSSLLYDPTESVFNEDGSFSRSSNLTINNPLSLIEGISNTDKINRTFGNVFIDYEILKGLSTKLNFGYDNQNVIREIYNSRLTIRGQSENGIASITTLNRSNQLVEFTMNYVKEFNEKSTLNILGGTTYQNFLDSQFSGTISGFPSDATGVDNLNLGDDNFDGLGSNKAGNSLLSYIGRINYNYLNKYLLTGTLRADGSSRFGENNKFGYFPSFAFGWKLDKESFVPDIFDELKLRASWGITGNQDIGNYNSISTYSSGLSAILDDQLATSLRPSRIANPNLKWESTAQIDIGIDARILGGRVSATLDYFNKETRDLLINKPLPTASGYESILSNVGKMRNSGMEILLNSINISQENFMWSTTLNFSSIKNKITDLGNSSDIITGFVQNVGNTSIYRVGEPAASYYGYIVSGIFQSQSEVEASAQPDSQPGYPVFKDVNGDRKISPADQVVIGNPYPEFTYGIQNTISYKDLSFDFFIQGQQGADLININRIESMYPANFRRNRIAEQALNRWTPDNPDTKWPSGINPNAYGGGKVNSLMVDDASYLRLQSIRLAYNIPVKFARLMEVYVTGQNLITLTNYIGANPESNSFGRSNVKLDYNGYPLARTWVLGLKIGL
ncbi:TonB-dependent receptor [Arenibacter sp. S6351L]|uniref:TonB-dependent receptor n=1 Tax=Arenibacter sp. S6351L TaxID=2926407 RepID=UPI001FF4F0F1|nr:TonB-dependent receptor [Arenibacter sp. S6351L]MCK0135715.1 TonB-dependent receptor [Arenibacter sp. S6351L]